MRIVSFDSETHLISKGQMTPRVVCVSWAERDNVHNETDADAIALRAEGDLLDGIDRGLMLRTDGLNWLRFHLMDDGVTLVGHNVAYDLAVAVASDLPTSERFPSEPDLLPLIFDKYDKGLIHDTQVRQQLLDIATGEMKFNVDEDTGDVEKTSYHLADLSWRLLKKFLKKADTWRLKYALLDGVPLAEWPEDARRYAIDDAVTTLEVYEAQDKLAGGPIPNSMQQHRSAFALHLMSVWGVRTDGEAVAKLKESLLKDFVEVTNKLRPSGLLNIASARVVTRGAHKGETVPEKISKSTKAIQARVSAVFAAKNAIEAKRGGIDGERWPVPMTEPSKKFPKGQVSTAKKTLLDTGDPDLKLVAERGGVAKLVETYVPILESGTKVPINARFNVLVETGRTSCAKPNLQNPPRAGGVRQCFIPRDGWVFAFSDYDTLELRSLAQCCLDMLGRSDMAEALRRGEDLHLSFAAEKNNISYADAKALYDAGDNAIKEERQFCKISNFGFPGGLGADAFVEYAAGYGTAITSEKSHELKDNWFRRWSEMRDYFGVVKNLTESGGPIVQNRSGRVRGGASFCAAANGFFQGLAADGAKDALWAVTRECYTDKTSPMYGCRPVLFIHDEIVLEIPYRWWGAERAARAAKRLSEVMIAVMKTWIPDVPISAKPVMARRWFKGIEPVMVNGVLVPAKPVKEGKKTLWTADL